MTITSHSSIVFPSAHIGFVCISCAFLHHRCSRLSSSLTYDFPSLYSLCDTPWLGQIYRDNLWQGFTTPIMYCKHYLIQVLGPSQANQQLNFQQKCHCYEASTYTLPMPRVKPSMNGASNSFANRTRFPLILNRIAKKPSGLLSNQHSHS